ncbi:MAG TPA: methyltransferase domain-containing protein [Gammaproteobacteria bacterium]|nr:methyltransferase domain-containing protein [Gammaproteobacteria bacterium]
MNIESSVLNRYSKSAREREEALCCPVEYDAQLLKSLPKEIVEKDYGCGDPSRYILPGETVLDLGSGSGKVCYMAAQLVGDGGCVIGVDMNDDMLSLARKYQEEMAEKLGSDRVQFHKGHIQDLALDVEDMEQWLEEHPVSDSKGLAALETWQKKQRMERPLIASDSIDLVISNCVLNLVSDESKEQLVNEIFRVVKPGGRIAISDIVSDEDIPEHLKYDEKLWSGCISGAFQEQEIIQMFRDAGFQAVCIDQWSVDPWKIIEGIEFRSVTITAVKPEDCECLDKGHAVIYRGPFSTVYDDDGHEFPRGERIAVCERTFRFLTEGPCCHSFIGIKPAHEQKAIPWCAPAGKRRLPSETKGRSYKSESNPSDCC